MKLLLSPSSLQAFLTCPELYRWTRVEGLESKVTSAPRLEGRAFHAFLETFLLGLGHDAAFQKIAEIQAGIDLTLLTKDQIEKLDHGFLRVRAMARGYIAAYRQEGTRWPTMLTERAAEVTLSQTASGDEIALQGRIDRLAKDREGWWIFETKTRSRGLEPDDIRALGWDSQLCAYYLLARKILGERPVGVVYDTVIKTQHRQTQKETPASFEQRLTDLYVGDATHEPKTLFQREMIRISEETVARWKAGVESSARFLLQLKSDPASIWPRNTQACTSHYGSCDMLELCSSGVASLKYKQREGVKT